MTDKILVVTAPDDTLLQGIRITHVDLTEEQSSVVSSAMMNSTLPHTVINYVWKTGNRIDWLLDKISKSDLVIFNADVQNNGLSELVTGWVAAQHNSYYFGNLRDLHLANDRAIYSSNDVLFLMEKVAKKHDEI